MRSKRRLFTRKYGKGLGSIFRTGWNIIKGSAKQAIKKVVPIAKEAAKQLGKQAIEVAKEHGPQIAEKAKELGVQKIQQLVEQTKNGKPLKEALADTLKSIPGDVKEIANSPASKQMADKIIAQAKTLVKDSVEQSKAVLKNEAKAGKAGLSDLLPKAMKDVEDEAVQSGEGYSKKKSGSGLRVAGTGLQTPEQHRKQLEEFMRTGRPPPIFKGLSKPIAGSGLSVAGTGVKNIKVITI